MRGCRSPSTRRAWIEIAEHIAIENPIGVALHPEGVDRNYNAYCEKHYAKYVALHPEGVDRNRPHRRCARRLHHVALHPEGVDKIGRAHV